MSGREELELEIKQNFGLGTSKIGHIGVNNHSNLSRLNALNIETKRAPFWTEGLGSIETHALTALIMNGNSIAKLCPLDAYAIGVLFNRHANKSKTLNYIKKIYELSEKYSQEMSLKIEQKRPVSMIEEYDAGVVSKVYILNFSGKLTRELTIQDLLDNPALFIGLNSEQSFRLGYLVGKNLL